MRHLTRRAFLWLAACTSPGATLFAQMRGNATAPISADDFLRLSQRLTARDALDAKMAPIYLGALLAMPGNGPLLAKLVQGPAIDPAETALEREIIDCWYTGTYPDGATRRVASYTGALMWTVIGRRPLATCAGVFGAWSRPPRTD